MTNATKTFGVYVPAPPTNTEADGMALLIATEIEVELAVGWTVECTEEELLVIVDSVAEVCEVREIGAVEHVSPEQTVAVAAAEESVWDWGSSGNFVLVTKVAGSEVVSRGNL